MAVKAKINVFNIIIGIVAIIICNFVIYKLAQYFQFNNEVREVDPYVLKTYEPGPLNEGDDSTITWIIHKYVPDHNAGSEWMAHAMNQFLIQNMDFNVNVIVDESSVYEYERVNILEATDYARNEDFIRHSGVILSHHTQEPHAVKTAGIIKRPIVCLMHDDGRKKNLQEYIRLPYRKNIYLIHNSYWLKEYYSLFGFQSIVLFPPVFWRDYAVDTNHEYVVLINCNRNKGGEVLIEIARRMPDIQFLGVKGAYNRQYLGNLPNLTYVEQTPYIKKIYAQTDILLMPSKEESWGRTAIEAMSSGIPVIANPTPGLLESCGSAGIFCNRDKPDAWVREIRRLKSDPDYYKSVSDACKERAISLDPMPQLKAMGRWLKGLRWQD